jgi:hypothetical protein
VVKLRIVRLEETDEGALGVLLVRGEIFCMTLQPDSRDRERYQIPAGVYPLRRFHGARWRNTLEIVVSGHTALLFHAGNWEEDSTGCVLVGSEAGKLRGQRAVTNSGTTFERFQGQVIPQIQAGDQILIEDCYGQGFV